LGVKPEMSRRVYTRYKAIVEYLGYKQLDVYRVMEGKKTVDIVRLMDPMSGKAAVINLGAPRESLSYWEFLERIINGAKSAGLPLNERRIQELREKFKPGEHGMEESRQEAQQPQ